MKININQSIRVIVCFFVCLVSGPAWAGQTINANFPESCRNQGGTAGTVNFITDFDGGTFGSESGAPNQSPNIDPYPATVVGGNFVNFYDIEHGDYAYIANPVTPRNRFQHAEVTDPVYGATGRFFASDPDVDTPTMNFEITNVIPNQNYELSFWAANSEPTGRPNLVNAVVDNIISYSTGLLQPNPDALPWQRYGFIFNAGDRTTIQLSMASTQTGARGRDFYLDNVEMRLCELSTPGTISGRIFSDVNENNIYEANADGTLSNIGVQLFDTQGTASAADDIFVSVTSSNADGLYQFNNLAENPNYQLRVVTTDTDLPSGASPGTAITRNIALASGGDVTGQDFGFDLSEANLEGSKNVRTFEPDTYAVPGEDLAYTIQVHNRGNGEADLNSLFLVDNLPDALTYRNLSFDATTAESVKFEQVSAGLNFDFSRDVGFALSGPPPANMAACNYTPSSGYDENVAYVCFAPKGRMQGGNPSPNFSVSFRTRIN